MQWHTRPTKDTARHPRSHAHTKRLQHIVARSDPQCKHFARPIEFVKLPPRPGHTEPLVASIFEAPWYNRLRDFVSFGSNAFRIVKSEDGWQIAPFEPQREVDLLTFLDFAVGAAECRKSPSYPVCTLWLTCSVEILHHGHEIINGELRGDAFHFCENGRVAMINFGGGARSFENGLTSTGWNAISKEAGIELKLAYIAPEQTGRLPAEPDSRTDIYSLGILFYSMLVGEPPFQGDTPLDVMQQVLTKRIPPVSSQRMDVPDALSSVIAKMTMKNIEERYHSTSGLKQDLTKIRDLLCEGDTAGLESFEVGSKDISCFFNLPIRQIGREEERKTIIDTIEAVSRRRRHLPPVDRVLHSVSSNSSFSDANPLASQLEDIVSDSTSSRGSEPRHSIPNNLADVAAEDGNQDSRPIPAAPSSHFSGGSRLSAPSITDSLSLSVARSSQFESSSIYRGAKVQASTRTARRRLRSEVIAIQGSTGLGKTRLIQSVQANARSSGYFGQASFTGKKAPFEPVLRLMSSIFRQVFSETDVATEFHIALRNYLKSSGVWDILHPYLDLPKWLLSDSTSPKPPSPPPFDVELGTDAGRRASTPPMHSSLPSTTVEAWLKNGGTTKSARFITMFIEIVRLLAVHKLCIWCLEDVQFADPESAELIQRVVAAKIPLVIILTYRDEADLPGELRCLLPQATKINLKPFSEEQTAEYVAETLHRDSEYILPLVAVIQEKSHGNIFYIREILDTCYRTHCIYYSWKENEWVFDLDCIFKTLESAEYGSVINNDFITKRISELPTASRKLLAWCSLLSGTIRFSFVKQLLTTKYAPDYADTLPLLRSPETALAALDGVLAAYILMQAEDDDKFRK